MPDKKPYTILPNDENRKKRRILWIVVLVFMIVIITIWGYSLKTKIDQVTQKSKNQAGLLDNTKEIWQDVFRADSNTYTTTTTTDLNVITVGTTTTTSTSLNTSTVNIIEGELKNKIKNSKSQ